MKIERRLPQIVRLLADTRDILNDLPKLAEGSKRISTKDLIDKLTKIEEAGWDEANHGRPITAHWLRERFVGVLDPAGSIGWYEDVVSGVGKRRENERRHVRGYGEYQFRGAFETYIPYPSDDGSSGSESAKNEKTYVFHEDNPEPDGRPQEEPSGSHPVQKKPNKNTAVRGVETTEPDEHLKKGEGIGGAGDQRGPSAAEGLSPSDPPKPQQNGHDREAFSRQYAIDPMVLAAILAFLDENPDASAAQIRKAVGAKPSVIKRVLDEWGPAP